MKLFMLNGRAPRPTSECYTSSCHYQGLADNNWLAHRCWGLLFSFSAETKAQNKQKLWKNAVTKEGEKFVFSDI